MSKHSSRTIHLLFLTLMATTVSAAAGAQTLPSSADIDSVKPNQQAIELRPMSPTGAPDESTLGIAEPPADAKLIKITLRNITIKGATVYEEQEFRSLYEADLNKEITLDKIWHIAAGITKRYRADGYFLSRAYVPAQEVAEGNITIGVVEGYIGDVTIDQKFANNRAVKQIINTIKRETPITVHTLERQHLLLSDLPGMETFQGVLTPMKGAPEGAVQLIFAPRPIKTKNTYVGFDNMGSRYLGPYQLSGSWQGQVVPLQKTFVSGTVSVPTDELAAVNVSHQIPVAQDLKVELSGGYTVAEPGYTIKSREIESKALTAGVALNYQIIRQRQENLALRLALDARNSESTILGSELTEDRIRALRLSGSYDCTDDLYGYNAISMTISQGLPLLDASDANDLNLSRDGAKPDFTKLEVQYNRLQGINEDWSALVTVNAQKSSGSVYSSEEFGFGGQSLGRAYDPSEISGDDGIAGGVEFRYQSLPAWQNTNLQPFAFYDIGKVWNDNLGQEKKISASSTGLGVRFQHISGISGTVQAALPLTKSVDAPIYGSNGSNAQISFQVGYSF